MKEQELVDEIENLLNISDIVYIHQPFKGPSAVVLNIHTFDWLLNFVRRNQQDPNILDKLLINHGHLEPDPDET